LNQISKYESAYPQSAMGLSFPASFLRLAKKKRFKKIYYEISKDIRNRILGNPVNWSYDPE
jgi:hypothetical protein